MAFSYVDETKAHGADVVDEVVRGAERAIEGFVVSSMNSGRMVEPNCNSTENHGKVTRRTLPFARAIRPWRPDR